MEKRCKKCGTKAEPARKWVREWDDTVCCDECPEGEHLHLTCSCGFSGIAPCADSKELGEPFTGQRVPPQPTDSDTGVKVKDVAWLYSLWRDR